MSLGGGAGLGFELSSLIPKLGQSSLIPKLEESIGGLSMTYMLLDVIFEYNVGWITKLTDNMIRYSLHVCCWGSIQYVSTHT